MDNRIENRSYDVDLEFRASGDGRTIFGIAVPYNKEQRIGASLIEVFRKQVLLSIAFCTRD